MNGHDIIVIGTSAGGLKALSSVITQFPPDLPAAVFIVQHLSSDRPSLLAQILSSVSRLPVLQPEDGTPIERGRIYVARPDHHLLLEPETIRVRRGPQENRYRPSIDALFRSAAMAYGPRVVGVVLTGYLDDGTVGLQAIKHRGGVTIVQDPLEAEAPGMPRNALRYVKVDHVVPLSSIASLLIRMTNEPAAPDAEFPVRQTVRIESEIAEQEMSTEELVDAVDAIGRRTVYTCPHCNGTLWQIGEDEPLRFRCHVGHAFTSGVFMTAQAENLENALWSAVRLMEEKIMLTKQLATRRRGMRLYESADRYADYAAELESEVAALRELILDGAGTNRADLEANSSVDETELSPEAPPAAQPSVSTASLSRRRANRSRAR